MTRQYFIAILMVASVGLFQACDTAKTSTLSILPADKDASKETVALYNNLQRLQDTGIIFGHQDALAYGINWKYEPGRSDVKEVTGQYPALYGWELGHLELDSPKSLDNVPFDQMKKLIKEGYHRGGAITISWHPNSPLNGKTAWDTTKGTVGSILPGAPRHAVYLQYLDRVAKFIGDLKGDHGEAIPVLFRPFHELTGNWFWWCQNTCTPEEYTSLWKFTKNYLQEVKQLHNILYVYNTADFNSREGFLERYPGDEFVDVISFDAYQTAGNNEQNKFAAQLDKQLGIVDSLGKEKNKIVALAETGYEAIPQADWWTATLLPVLQKHRLSYVLVWRNAGLMEETGKMHYYAPYPGQVSAVDFIKFSKENRMIFETKIKQANIYEWSSK